MANQYRIFTIRNGAAKEGAKVNTFTLSNGTKIPAIVVGEEGRGRALGVLPVSLTKSQFQTWQEKDSVEIRFAEIGQSRSGKPKLFSKEKEENTAGDSLIAVMSTPIGYRGGNSHTGDRQDSLWSLTTSARIRVQELDGKPEGIDLHGECSSTSKTALMEWAGDELTEEEFEEKRCWDVFPGKVIIEGRIAQGAAGGMGSGTQMIATIPVNTWFRTSYSGRRYGAPSAHYYKWDGNQVLAVTWDERQILEAMDDDEIVQFVANQQEANKPLHPVLAPLPESSLGDLFV